MFYLLTLARARGLKVRYPLSIVDRELLRVLTEERIMNFSMLKYTLYSTNLKPEAKRDELANNFGLMFPWVEIEKQQQIEKERAELLSLREELLSGS